MFYPQIAQINTDYKERFARKVVVVSVQVASLRSQNRGSD